MTSFHLYVGKQISPASFLSIQKLDQSIYASSNCIGVWKGIEWVLKSREGYVMLYDESKHRIAGYASLLSLRRGGYEMIRSGKVADGELPVSEIEWLGKRKKHRIYVSSIVLRDDYRGTTAAARLTKALLDQLRKLESSGVEVEGLLADAVSEEGASLCKRCGLEFLMKTDRGSSLYEKEFPNGLPENFPACHPLPDLH